MYRKAGYTPSAKVCSEGFLERVGGQIYTDASMAGEMFCDGFPYAYDLEELRRNPDAAQCRRLCRRGAA